MKVVDNVNKKVEAVLPYTIIEDNLTMEYDYSKHEKINDFLFIRQISKKYDLYAFRFQKTEQQVIEEYLNNISKDADEEFLAAAKETIKVKRVYFPVRYVQPKGKVVEKQKAYGHYETTGYKGTGEIKNNKVDVKLSEVKSFKTDGYSTTTEVKETFDIPKYLSHLSEDFYYTHKVDMNSVVLLEQISDYYVISPIKNVTYYSGLFDEDGYRYEMLQLLFFPLWHIEVKYNNKYYYTEVSDTSNVIPKNYVRSKEATKKIIKDINKNEDRENSQYLIGLLANFIAIITLLASIIVHFGFFNSANFSYILENGVLTKLINLMNYENIDNGILKFICAPFYLIFNIVNFVAGDNILGYIFCINGFTFNNNLLKYKDKYISFDSYDRISYIYDSDLIEYNNSICKAISTRKIKTLIKLIGIAIIIVYNVYLCINLFK